MKDRRDPDSGGHALRWVQDAEPGIRRIKRGRGFSYVGPDGRPIREPEVIARIGRLAIPPAYRDVWICASADGHLQATGRDARGRKQYRYHELWQRLRGLHKFESLARFGLLLPRIRRRATHLLESRRGPDRERVVAALIRLLDTTWMRVGNWSYARDNESYGLSTLLCRHVSLRGSALRLNFVGKSGVRHVLQVEDPKVAAVVRCCRELPGQELFRYVDERGHMQRIGSEDVNAWLAQVTGDAFTAKDYRTWHASVYALELWLEHDDHGENAAAVAAEIVKAVARRLGNTPAICRKAYIHPAVLSLITDADTQDAQGRLLKIVHPVPRRGLNLAERQLLALIDGDSRRPAVADMATGKQANAEAGSQYR